MKQFDRGDTRTSFIDMLISGQMNLFVIFMMALVLINPITAKKDGVETKAEYIITMTWPDDVDCDVDIWVRGPSGTIVWFRQRDADNMHLERDDTGTSNDSRVINGKTYITRSNTERWVLRSLVPGEYVVNAHLYRVGATCVQMVAKTGLPVRLVLSKINPLFNDVHLKEIVMEKPWEETHAFRFSIDQSGNPVRIWEEAIELVKTNLSQGESQH